MSIKELRESVQAARDAYHAIVNEGTRAQLYEASKVVKAAQNALVEALIAGCKPCPTSGLPPTAVIQEDDKFGELVEIGSRVCKHYRARGIDQQSAMQRWNDGVDELLRRMEGFTKEQRKMPMIVEDHNAKLVGVPESWHVPKRYR